jgi:tetratricopeptide (TPR) repeat protein
MKRIIFALLLTASFQTAFSQSQKIEDLYMDYTMVRNSPNQKAAKEKTLALLARSSELNAQQVANVNYHMGRIYEEQKQADLAIPHYEKVIKMVPGYYVAQRALGFLLLEKSNVTANKVTAAAKAKNAALHAESFKTYKKQILALLPYLEKSQVCDADDRTLQTITNLYKSIKEPGLFSTLNTRLKEKGADCITLLDD